MTDCPSRQPRNLRASFRPLGQMKDAPRGATSGTLQPGWVGDSGLPLTA